MSRFPWSFIIDANLSFSKSCLQMSPKHLPCRRPVTELYLASEPCGFDHVSKGHSGQALRLFHRHEQLNVAGQTGFFAQME